MECGHKKGGHYFCWFCDSKASVGHDLQHLLFADVVDLNDKCEKLKLTTIGQNLIQEGALHYVSGLDKAGLISDLHQRGVTFHQSETTESLKAKLENEMKGTVRLPALLFTEPDRLLADYRLEKYVVLPVEPLHTISDHIKNLYGEIPHHLNKRQRKIFDQGLKAVFSGKQVKRGADYRKASKNCEFTSKIE